MTSVDLSKFETVDRAGEHPNGPIVLIKNRPDGGEDRLHWWTDQHNRWSNRHNHRWNFRSRCLYGEMEEEMLRVYGDGGIRNYINDAWEDMGPVRWDVLLTRKIVPNPSRRYLGLDEFHRVRAISETITLVEAGPAERNYSIFLPQLPNDDTITGKFRSYDATQAANALMEIRRKLA